MAGKEPPYLFDQFQLDEEQASLLGPGGRSLELRPKTFALLSHLLRHQGQLLSRTALLDALWPSLAVSDDSLTQCVSELRRALGQRADAVLRTLPRRGYVLIAEVRRGEARRPPPGAMPRRHDLLLLETIHASTGNMAGAGLAEALMLDLLGELVRFEDLRVVQNGATTGYRLAGEIAARSEGWRVLLRLTEAGPGHGLIWQQVLDHPRHQRPQFAEGMVRLLAASIRQQVLQESLRRARQRPPEDMTPRDLCLQAARHLRAVTGPETLLAAGCLELALKQDPAKARARAMLSAVRLRGITHGWGGLPPGAAMTAALDLGREAVSLEPDSPTCLAQLSHVLSLLGQWDEALAAAKAAARAASPADLMALTLAGEALARGGKPAQAVALLSEALRLSPDEGSLPQGRLGLALLLAGEVEPAIAVLKCGLAGVPEDRPAQEALLVATHQQGDADGLRQARAALARLSPAAAATCWPLRDAAAAAWFAAVGLSHLSCATAATS
jgi:adenylate cyclase